RYFRFSPSLFLRVVIEGTIPFPQSGQRNKPLNRKGSLDWRCLNDLLFLLACTILHNSSEIIASCFPSTRIGLGFFPFLLCVSQFSNCNHLIFPLYTGLSNICATPLIEK